MALAVIGVAAVAMYEVTAQDEPILVKYPHDYRDHEMNDIVSLFGTSNGTRYVWIWNPDNIPITYDNDKYAPDIIHEGNWDIARQIIIDPDEENWIYVTVNGTKLHEQVSLPDFVFANYFENKTDTQADQIQALQETVHDLQAQLDKQAKKITYLESQK